MAHYAFIDENNVVVDVIVGRDESNMDWEGYYSLRRGLACKRTSFNTHGGVNPNGEPFRKNYAGVGFAYDAQRDAFIPPKPFASWVLNEESCLWEAPTPMPTDGKQYQWDEFTTSWTEALTDAGLG